MGMDVAVTAVQDGWAQLSLAGGLTGWLPQNHLRPFSAIPQSESERRQQIITSAVSLMGVPYQWGGESSDTGFDCSGLTMVVYQLNGLDLPRSSSQQWKEGRPVKRSQLAKGDLVFFATKGGRRVSHVGIYTGSGKFLHAPRRGRKITISSLSSRYYKTRYLGARSYL